MIICDNCGRENEDEYKFCLGCGSALSQPDPEPEQPSEPEMIACPHCDTTVPSNFKFCGACGGPIKGEPQQPAAQQHQSAAQQSAQRQTPAQQQSAAPAMQQTGQPASAQAAQPAAQQASPGAAQQPAQSPASSQPADEMRSTDPAGKPKPSASGQHEALPSDEQVAGRLVVIRPDGTEGAEIALKPGEQTIGRDSGKKVLANDPFLSPEHATFTCTGDAFFVRDEESLNGVFVRVDEPVELRHGDQLRLGQELLRFEDLSEVEAVIERTEEETKIAGSPDEETWGRLCLIAGPDRVTRAFALGDDAVIIGRESGDILFRDDGFVSGKHARISRKNDKPVLEDLGSSNGTYRRIRQETKLEDGALLLIGQQLFRLTSA